MITTVAIAGAGTMGSGIALSSAKANYKVKLFDLQPAALEKAEKTIVSNVTTLLEKGKITVEQKADILNNITFHHQVEDLKADLVIEAIIEKLEAKIDLLTAISNQNDEKTILASNTSSLSINALQKALPHPNRVAGLHFFNPAHLMKLVEVIQGDDTSNDIIETLVSFSKSLEKVPVVCKDAPGFIVNRVARHFYLEAMKILEMNQANMESIDAALENAGFKMGPFKLMDMIGMDINLAVSQSLYDAFNQAPRFQPSPIQIDKVSKGELGRKTGKGFYQYN